jgi:hypothetical protein
MADPYRSAGKKSCRIVDKNADVASVAFVRHEAPPQDEQEGRR